MILVGRGDTPGQPCLVLGCSLPSFNWLLSPRETNLLVHTSFSSQSLLVSVLDVVSESCTDSHHAWGGSRLWGKAHLALTPGQREVWLLSARPGSASTGDERHVQPALVLALTFHKAPHPPREAG